MVREYPCLHCRYWKIQSVKIVCLILCTGSERVRQEFTAFKLQIIQFQYIQNISHVTLSLEKNLHFCNSLNKYFTMLQFSSKRSQPQNINFNAGSTEFYSDPNYLRMHSMKHVNSRQMPGKIKQVIESASKLISRLLANLKYLYETNGIKYQINNYHNVIMRILTPHQLLSHFHIVDNYEIFWANDLDKEHLMKCKFQRKYAKLKGNLKEQGLQKPLSKTDQWYEQPSKEPKMSENYQDFNKFEMNLEKNHYFMKQNSSESDLQLNESQKISYGNRPILGADIQRRLVLWIIEELVSKKGVKLRQIAKQAKQFAYNIKGFKSSRGWVSRFFCRHPYLKQMINQSKAGNYQMIKLMYLKIKEKIFNTPIGQYEELENENEKSEDQILKQAYIQSPDSQIKKQFVFQQSKTQKQTKKGVQLNEEFHQFEQGQNSIYEQSQVSQYPRLRVPKQNESYWENNQSEEQIKSKRKDRTKKN